MEGNGEISDTDSGVILHSGSDSPQAVTKDVLTHTRAMKVKHQELQDKLQRCILELKKLCIREAELTGHLSEDYPLLPGEKPPVVHRRVGAAFKLEEQSFPQGSQDSELSLVDAELALQMKICEAARRLWEEPHVSKAVRRSRLHQCRREEKKLRRLQDAAFQLRLERGRSSPLPAFNITSQGLGTSDDSSLSDSVVQDEEVPSQSRTRPSPGAPVPSEADPPPASSRSCVDASCTPPPAAPPTPGQPHPLSLTPTLSLSPTSVYDAPPIQNSPWSESSLDQPYQKSRKSRSSSKASSPVKSELLPPLEVCLAQCALPVQLSHLKLSRTQSSSTPSTPEMRVHRQLSLRVSSPESSVAKERGRPRGPRRRLTDCGIKLSDVSTISSGNCANSEDSNSERSFSSYNSSPCRELLCDAPRAYTSPCTLPSPVGSLGSESFSPSAVYYPPRQFLSPWTQNTFYNEDMVYPPDMDMGRSYYAQAPLAPPNRYEYRYKDAAVAHQRGQRPGLPEVPPAQPQPRPAALPRHVVSEQLKSWHRRSQLKAPRSRSLDRQGAVRVRSVAPREAPAFYSAPKYHEQMLRRAAYHSRADTTPERWIVDDGSHFASQL